MTDIDYARSLPFVTDLYLCGHSQGGLTVILAAALKKEFISGIMPLSPAVMIPEQARAGKLLGVPFAPNHIPDTIVCEEYSWKLKGNYIRVAQTIYAENIYTRYIGPVLLVHGDADESVPVTCSIDAQKLYRNADLKIINGDTHCFDFHLDQAVQAVKEWMQVQLEKDTGSCYEKQNT